MPRTPGRNACGSLPVWRRDEENRPVALRITTRGLSTIQVDDGGALCWPDQTTSESTMTIAAKPITCRGIARHDAREKTRILAGAPEAQNDRHFSAALSLITTQELGHF